jgi:hypothetical protein
MGIVNPAFQLVNTDLMFIFPKSLSLLASVLVEVQYMPARREQARSRLTMYLLVGGTGLP